ncbi:MAG TPA: nickel pincer cofactor biosynthesis protein LarB [Tessaracoccus flavescens]|uniref:Nickel pincer cofactor biosynthesis protein LarB n=1 Tax=Tessaracoccus flavescens TaxID=399497 RepID=A0A921ERJ0_9ACTN|nr:nickel pincer cofactor biosynthesis protein LarB [Tessaracoccus flavescens]
MSATLDFDRYARRGYAEAVFCLGKTTDQIAEIARQWRDKAATTDDSLGTVLFTRITPEQADAVGEILDGAAHDPLAKLLAWPAAVPEPTGGKVVVVCAGTSDLPVAREAALTVRYLGREVEEVVDVGVAGLNRILSRVETLRSADVVVAVAGMDAALVPVVAGLVACPVVAVPTSVGYGAAFDGVAALLSMLNSCAPGVGVVNIDNGYGAGHLAAQIAAPRGGGAHHA